jgi:alpha-glucan,water dikinase
VGGEEDIPWGVVALLTPANVDVLSHSAVRARNGGVVMATCFDAAAVAALESLSGQTVLVTVAQARHTRFFCATALQ